MQIYTSAVPIGRYDAKHGKSTKYTVARMSGGCMHEGSYGTHRVHKTLCVRCAASLLCCCTAICLCCRLCLLQHKHTWYTLTPSSMQSATAFKACPAVCVSPSMTSAVPTTSVGLAPTLQPPACSQHTNTWRENMCL